ncbi:MAG: hypothetical protein ABIP90_10745 [Vicinamibacterales bacterium]
MALAGFGAMATLTLPAPVPPADPVMVIQLRSDVALQLHWFAVVTPTVVAPPDDGTDSDDTESV